MDEFKRFVEWAGGKKEAAELLGVQYQRVQKICNNERQVSKELALLVMEAAGRRFSLPKLLQGKTNRAA